MRGFSFLCSKQLMYDTFKKTKGNKGLADAINHKKNKSS